MGKQPNPTTSAAPAKPAPAPAPVDAASLPKNKTGKARILADRDYLDASGKPCPESQAKSLRVTWLGDTYHFAPGNNDATMLLAMRSAYTFWHNGANSIINHAKKPGTIADAKAAMRKLESEWAAGKWDSRRDIGAGGPAGPKIDPATMAAILLDFAVNEKKRKPGEVISGYPVSIEGYVKRMAEDKTFGAQVRADPKFLALYRQKSGQGSNAQDQI